MATVNGTNPGFVPNLPLSKPASQAEAPGRPLDPKRIREILRRMGYDLKPDARVLDLGCGAGKTVYAFRDAGYINTVGFDIKDYLALRDPADRGMFTIASGDTTTLPFEDNSFDLVISEQVLEHVMDQVRFLQEIHRILRPGGHSLHALPARYCPIEPHMKVPFAGVFAHRWWYRLWALMGVRNPYQKGLPADEATDRNIMFFVGALRYIPNSFYGVVWRRLGFEWQWTDQEHFDTSPRPAVRWIGKVNRYLPVLEWLNRTFNGRRVCLKKPA